MKKLLPYLLLVLSVNIGCREESGDGDQIVECVGVSFYYLENHSKNSFSLRFTGPDLNNEIDSVTVIKPEERVLVGQDAEFGSMPTPISTFSTFALYSDKDGLQVRVYNQDPIQNDLWRKQKRNVTDPEFGCQNVDYILTVTDDMLK